MRTIATLAALAVAALVVASTAAAGKPDIVDLPPLELVAVPQHDCGDYELLLSGTLERRARFTVDDAGEAVAEHRQIRITGTVWNSIEPSNAAPYLRSIQIDWDYTTGKRLPRERNPRGGLDGRRLRGCLSNATLPGRALRQLRARRLGPPLRGPALAGRGAHTHH